MFKSFNNTFAFVLAIGIIGVLVGTKAAGIDMQGEVVGSLLASLTLIVQHYFRKAEPKP